MNSTTKYISVNATQAEVLNNHLGISATDENAFYDGCELLLEYDYNIEDVSFDHELGTEEGVDVDLGDIYAVLSEDKVNMDDLFDLSIEQLDELSQHAREEAQASYNEPDEPAYYDED